MLECTMKSVLLHIRDDAALDRRLQVALDMCRQHDGHLTCLQVTPFNSYIAFDPLGGVYGQDAVLSEVRAREAEVRSRIEAHLAQDDVRWDWATADGDEVQLLTAWSALSDMVVVSQGATDDVLRTRQLVDDLVVAAQCAVLIVPDALDHLDATGPVVLAWNASAESARALRQSLPVLKAAATVHIVTVGEDSADMPQTAASAYLSRHVVKSELIVEPSAGRKAHDVIAQVAHERGANLIIMGAYGRSRLRETLLGGVTRTLLARSGIALLMAH